MNNEKCVAFNTPSYIYIPYDNVEKLTLRKNNVVYYGELLGKMNSETNIYSSVSGIIKGTSKVQVYNRIVDTLVIENDYKDKPFKLKVGKEKFDIYKRKESNELLNTFNIIGKYNGKKNLMIDLLVDSNHLENKYISYEYHYELLETIDALLTIYNLNKAYIAINDGISEEVIKRYSGIYPNIKFVNRVKNNESSVNYTGYEILKIYNALKFNKNLCEKLITILNGKKATIVKTKINVLVNELLESLNIKNGSVNIITYDNEKISNYKGIITENIKTIVIV